MTRGYGTFSDLRRQTQEIFDGTGTNLPEGASINEYRDHLSGMGYDERAVRTAVYELQTHGAVVAELGGRVLTLVDIPQGVQLYNS